MIKPLTRRSSVVDWAVIIAIILLAWALRLVYLDAAPPGWRDDELINIYALSGELFDGRLPLYFTGASGHEPLYHYLHAGTHAMLGYNVLSGHLLSVFLGTLTIPLTYSLARRLFGFWPAVLGSLALATSFWSLMYSRTAIRHISLVPFALGAFYLIWLSYARRDWPVRRWAIPLGLVLGLGLYTYPVARLLPALLISFALYLVLFHCESFRRVWAGYAVALAIAAALALPLVLAISRGSSAAAAQGIGADARLVELALPIRELLDGNPRSLLENTWVTLGMFHSTGDPEWLYNIADRPVFNLFGGLLFWVGLVICLYRWRSPRHFFLVLWLGFGLLPTVLSIPPASLSHSILVQPLAYLLPVLALTWANRRIASRNLPFAIRNLLYLLLILFVTTTVFRDLRDYFNRWPQDSLVRFLYRADYRDGAGFIDARPEETDWAVGSLLMGPWDRLALQVDSQRDDLAMRIFDPQRALITAAAGDTVSVLLTSYPEPAAAVKRLLREQGLGLATDVPSLVHYTLALELPPGEGGPLARFANGLELLDVAWDGDVPPSPDQEAVLVTNWRVAAPLELPPMPIVANPPPPGVYSGPRLAVFVHLLAGDGTLLVVDDGLWVDPLTLQLDDRFIQLHRLELPPGAPAGLYTLELGLYDPLDGMRWPVVDAAGQPVADHVPLPVDGP